MPFKRIRYITILNHLWYYSYSRCYSGINYIRPDTGGAALFGS